MGVRIGNWLTVDQSRTLLARLQADSLRGKRDRAILSLLIGCGLRRAELVRLGPEDFQVREEHGVIADLIGKGKHIRTVPVPVWAKRAVDEWTDASKISTGALFRRVGRLEKIWGADYSFGMTVNGGSDLRLGNRPLTTCCQRTISGS